MKRSESVCTRGDLGQRDRQNVTEDPESGDSGNPDTITLTAGAKA